MLDQAGKAESADGRKNLTCSLQVNVNQLTVEIVAAFTAVINGKQVRGDSSGCKSAEKLLNLIHRRQAGFTADRCYFTEFNFKPGIQALKSLEKPGDNSYVLCHRVE